MDRIYRLILLAVAAFSGLVGVSAACTNSSGGWVLCQGLLPGVGANGTGFTPLYNSILDNFPQTNINSSTGLPIQNHIGYFIVLVGIGISELLFIEIGAKLSGERNQFAVLNYSSVMFLITAIVFEMFGLVGSGAVDVAVGICGLTIIASLFFRKSGGG